MRPGSRAATLLAACAVAALAACGKEEAKAPPVRPVLSVVVAPRNAATFGFAGTVQPRYKVTLGFQVLGRVIARNVEVGDQVKAGQVLAAIDPVALELATRSSKADLATAQGKLSNASGVESRQRTLLERSVATQAQFEGAQQGQDTATAAVRKAEANLAKAQEQLGYAQLRSDADGIVTAVDAQVGQVVAAGQSVVTVARPDVKEAAVDVPEDVARDLKPGVAFDVALQLDPTIRTPGEAREIAPQADSVTRTRRVLVTLTKATEVFRLGTTVTAIVTEPAAPSIDLPRSALLERDGKNLVWVVDTAGTVSTREVKIARRDEGGFRVQDGLPSGTRVVTAGVNSLTEGQKVKVPGDGGR